MIDALAAARQVTAAEEAPQTSKRREGDPHRDYKHSDLQPDEAADFTQNDFDPVAPGRWDCIADGLDGVGSHSKCLLYQVGPIVERRADQHPREERGGDPKTVHFGVVLQAGIQAQTDVACHKLRRSARTGRSDY